MIAIYKEYKYTFFSIKCFLRRSPQYGLFAS